jgi:hypothetical protein
MGLPGAECDDAANRIVGGNADRDPVAGNNLDAKPPHAPAELGQNFMPGVALHSVKAPAMHRHDCSLHVDQIVFAQTGSKSFPARLIPRLRESPVSEKSSGNDCATKGRSTADFSYSRFYLLC